MENDNLQTQNITNETINIQKDAIKENSCGLSIASMVLGIIALLSCFFWFITIPCSILAIIFSVVGRKKGGQKMATAGLVLGILALVLFLLIITAFISFALGLAFSEYPISM